jgi:glycosyltransferase involved in cell wall biosynthesis
VSGRPLNLDVMILTKDEELNIEHSVRSVVGLARNVFVVDSESTDRTREIAENLGARVFIQPWLGFAKQKNWAIDELPWESDWIFILDADEAVQPDLEAELRRVCSRSVDDVAEKGFYINRYFVFLGRRLRHCGYYPSWNLRLFRRGFARYVEREVHEHMEVEGATGKLGGHMEHHDRRGLEVYMAKHNRYSTLEAKELIEGESQIQRVAEADGMKPSLFGTELQRTRWIKLHVYPKLPARWLFRFLYMYVIKLGVLDGLTGLRFCLFISAYELLISLKVIERREGLAPDQLEVRAREMAEAAP